jgi:hypothetical protein
MIKKGKDTQDFLIIIILEFVFRIIDLIFFFSKENTKNKFKICSF